MAMESVENIEDGTKGNNIKLTIDLAFQDSVDDLLKKLLQFRVGKWWGRSILKVCMQSPLIPKQVQFLSMSGLKHDLKTDELTPDSLGTITNVFVPGSVVKAAPSALVGKMESYPGIKP